MLRFGCLVLQLLESLLSGFSLASLLLLLSEHKTPAPMLFTKNYKVGPGLFILRICPLDPALGFPQQLFLTTPSILVNPLETPPSAPQLIPETVQFEVVYPVPRPSN